MASTSVNKIPILQQIQGKGWWIALLLGVTCTMGIGRYLQWKNSPQETLLEKVAKKNGESVAALKKWGKIEDTGQFHHTISDTDWDYLYNRYYSSNSSWSKKEEVVSAFLFLLPTNPHRNDIVNMAEDEFRNDTGKSEPYTRYMCVAVLRAMDSYDWKTKCQEQLANITNQELRQSYENLLPLKDRR